MSEETPVKSEELVQADTPEEAPKAPVVAKDVPPVKEKKAPKNKAKYYIPVEVGQQLTGKVKTIADFGAFIDLNMAVDGLVHISEMARRRITKVTDVLSEGEEVTVWIKSIDTERGRIGLTMLKPIERKYSDISEGDELEGEIKRIETYGVFVDIGLAREGLVHVSELAHDFVKNPSEVVTVGEKVQVKVLKIDSRKKQVNLSVKALLEPPAVEETQEVVEYVEEYVEDEEPMPTSMAVAFGIVDTGKRRTMRKKQVRRRKRNESMDDVISRTLRSGQKD